MSAALPLSSLPAGRPLPCDAPDDDRDDAAPTGPGWFDSSYELRAGLTVVEHAVSAELLAAWRR